MEECLKKEVRKQLGKEPKLLQIYSHRYMPMILAENPPILSLHGVDMICYGKNLQDYFDIEFGSKGQHSIDYQEIIPIPFWSDIM